MAPYYQIGDARGSHRSVLRCVDALDYICSMSADPVQRYCSACGSEVGSSAFCSNCGTAQAPLTPAPAPSNAGAPVVAVPAAPPAATQAEPSRRRVWPFAVGAILVLLVGAGVVLGISRGGDPSGAGAADSRTDGSGARVETFRSEVDPDHLAFGAGALWVAESDEPSRLVRYDPETTKPLGGLTRIGDYIDEIAFAGGDAWVAGSEKVSKIDGRTGELTGEEIETPIGITTDLVAQRGAVWQVDYGDNDYSDEDPRENAQLVRVDTRRGDHGSPVEIPDLSSDAAATDTAVYVGSASTDFTGVSRVTGAGSPLSKALDVGNYPALAATDDAVWVANQEDGTVLQLDATDLSQRGEPIDVGNHPRAIAVLEGVVWVAVYGDDAVVQIDERTGRRIGRPIRVGEKPDGLVAGGGRIWVRNSEDKTISVIDAGG